MVGIPDRETEYSRTCRSSTSKFRNAFDQPIKKDEARERPEQKGRTIHDKIFLENPCSIAGLKWKSGILLCDLEFPSIGPLPNWI